MLGVDAHDLFMLSVLSVRADCSYARELVVAFWIQLGAQICLELSWTPHWTLCCLTVCK